MSDNSTVGSVAAYEEASDFKIIKREWLCCVDLQLMANSGLNTLNTSSKILKFLLFGVVEFKSNIEI